MIKLGIIGCGKHAAAHAISLIENDNFVITAICDIDSDKMEIYNKSLNSQNGLYQTTSYKELIDNEDVEAILIITNSDSHLTILRYAIEKNKHVLIEKPLGANIEQIDEIISLAIQAKCVVLPALEYRYSAAFCNLYNYVNSDRLGGTKYITCTEHRDNFFLPWFYDSQKSGGSINDKVIHEFDLITQLFAPSKPIKVFAIGNQNRYFQGSTITGLFEKEYALDVNDCVDNAFIIVEYEDGKKACCTFNMYQDMPVDGMQMYVGGQNGKFVRISNLDTPDLIFTHNFFDDIKNFKLDNPDDIDVNGVLHPGTKRMHELFAKFIYDNNHLVCNWKQLRYAHLITLGAEKSIRENRQIDLLEEYKNPKIEKLLNKHDTGEVFSYPEYDMIEIAEKNKKIVRRNWLRRFLRRRINKNKEKQNIIRMHKRDFQHVIAKSLLESDISSETLRADLLVELILPWTTVYFDIDQNEVRVINKKPETSDKIVHIEITENGYLKLAEGASLNRLYLTRQIKVKGDIDTAKEYQELFVNIFKEIRQKLKS
jgi:predicted dehydrogenase